MSYYHDHNHVGHKELSSVSAGQDYAAVVGTVDSDSEQQITGRSGEHLKFFLSIGASSRYQVDINVQSSDGSEVEIYIADEALSQVTGNNPFGPPAYGVFPTARLSYSAIGLTNNQFLPASDQRLESQLEAALNESVFVSVYGMTYDDGGPNGEGVHEVHLNPQQTNEDGAIAVYIGNSGGTAIRRWFYFKFQGDSI